MSAMSTRTKSDWVMAMAPKYQTYLQNNRHFGVRYPKRRKINIIVVQCKIILYFIFYFCTLYIRTIEHNIVNNIFVHNELFPTILLSRL